MDELYRYMRAKMIEMQESGNSTVEVNCVEFMRLMKMLCYMRQIQRIVDDDV